MKPLYVEDYVKIKTPVSGDRQHVLKAGEQPSKRKGVKAAGTFVLRSLLIHHPFRALGVFNKIDMFSGFRSTKGTWTFSKFVEDSRLRATE